ncbi:copper amine oxidase N-terminal domain-containing protein [Butyricicoccus faecihominis]|uniref:copper amine oxidase N-terminal domain-containing protein n=1 Tax=Butyricicoccus faecihominis TaxID=1712515 RepID=UPI00247AD230|nr:copper amine oxidase N-terminal domain-containing protein [Butyricicoccus faecihominis]MCQ5130602.1 copper amine oxidase N-terminal domain-containing protein [Butyricicoccus faecihominis]
MKRNYLIKRIVCMTAVTLLISTLTFSATAASLFVRTINAQFGVSIKLNGKNFIPTDVNGKTVEPMIVNGTTYLPVRAVAEAAGFHVDWNGETYTVSLSNREDGEWIAVDSEWIRDMNKADFLGVTTYLCDFTTDVSLLKKLSGQDYVSGFAFSDTYARNQGCSIALPIKKNYHNIRFEIAEVYIATAVDREITKLSITDSDTNVVYKQCELLAGNNIIEADISGAERITISIDPADTERKNWTADSASTFALGNMQLR